MPAYGRMHLKRLALYRIDSNERSLRGHSDGKAWRVTVFLSLSPVTAAVLGVTLLGEPVTTGMMAGVMCVAAGLWVANAECPPSSFEAPPAQEAGEHLRMRAQG
jgi:hypothetical protein